MQVVTVTEELRAQRDERASPLNPNVETVPRSSKDVSLDVWCFIAAFNGISITKVTIHDIFSPILS